MNNALVGVIIFTLIEWVTLVVWGLLLKLGVNVGVSLGTQIVAAVVLLVGLFLEHYVSIQVGAGRPLFGPLPPNK